MLEKQMQQYMLLSRDFKKYTTQALKGRNLSYLRGHREHELVEPDFLKSRPNISLVAMPPFTEGKGGVDEEKVPGRTQIILYTHGNLTDSDDYTRGFEVQDGCFFRAVVRDPIYPLYPIHIPIIRALTQESEYLSSQLRKGWYFSSTSDVLDIADKTIERFKGAMQQVKQVRASFEGMR